MSERERERERETETETETEKEREETERERCQYAVLTHEDLKRFARISKIMARQTRNVYP